MDEQFVKYIKENISKPKLQANDLNNMQRQLEKRFKPQSVITYLVYPLFIFSIIVFSFVFVSYMSHNRALNEALNTQEVIHTQLNEDMNDTKEFDDLNIELDKLLEL